MTSGKRTKALKREREVQSTLPYPQSGSVPPPVPSDWMERLDALVAMFDELDAVVEQNPRLEGAAECIQKAKDVLTLAYIDDRVRPRIYLPHDTDGIGIEWATPDRVLAIEVGMDGLGTFRAQKLQGNGGGGGTIGDMKVLSQFMMDFVDEAPKSATSV